MDRPVFPTIAVTLAIMNHFDKYRRTGGSRQKLRQSENPLVDLSGNAHAHDAFYKPALHHHIQDNHGHNKHYASGHKIAMDSGWLGVRE